MELTNPSVIKEILTKNGFSFKKSLGQNFLINPTVCPKMAESAVENGETAVLEIGPGIGVLTAELAKKAEKVVAIELDERLRNVLPETLSEFDNVEVIFGDALKLDIAEIIETRFKGHKVAVCANLPYYVTSPIIMMLLESKLPISSVTVMVQKEAAERICADIGSRDAGAVTVAVGYYSSARTLFNVSRGSFIPAPNVDSAVIKLDILDKPPFDVGDEKTFFKFIKAAFAQRRKTLVNAVSAGCNYPKDDIKKVLSETDLSENVRAEALSMSQLAAVSRALSRLKA